MVYSFISGYAGVHLRNIDPLLLAHRVASSSARQIISIDLSSSLSLTILVSVFQITFPPLLVHQYPVIRGQQCCEVLKFRYFWFAMLAKLILSA